MTSCGRRKLESNKGRDLISQLPVDIKERILECLPTREVARTALLSTHWNDVWLRHGHLVFDKDFFQCVSKCEGDKVISPANIINDILSHHVGPVKKFILNIKQLDAKQLDPKLQQSDLDRWCCFLSRNGLQHLYLCDVGRGGYKLPTCIFSCRSIERLLLYIFIVDLPINAHCIFPGVTSLVFNRVEFRDNGMGIVYTIPNLKKLALCSCKGFSNFDINAPKLESFTVIGFMRGVVGLRWFTLHLKAIKVLSLCGTSLLCENGEAAALTFPTAINLQVMTLYELEFGCKKQLAVALQLIKKSPNLCELEITLPHCPCPLDDIKAASRLLEDPDTCIINQDLKMLKTTEIRTFRGSIVELLFVKMLLSKSPALERVDIELRDDTNASIVTKIQRESLCFPRASPKAQIVFTEYKYSLNAAP